jgi:hypothetical protein
VTIRYAAPVGFLAAKADALEGRDDSKDGYDVSWWCLNARPSGAEVAALVTERPAFKQELFQESVAQLHAAFRAPDYPGPDGYAREKHPDLQPGNDEYEQARNAAYTVATEVTETGMAFAKPDAPRARDSEYCRTNFTTYSPKEER